MVSAGYTVNMYRMQGVEALAKLLFSKKLTVERQLYQSFVCLINNLFVIASAFLTIPDVTCHAAMKFNFTLT